MILVRNIRLPLSCPDPEQEAVRQAYRTLRLRGNAPAQAGVAKLSVDARHGTPVLVYTIAMTRVRNRLWPGPRPVSVSPANRILPSRLVKHH